MEVFTIAAALAEAMHLSSEDMQDAALIDGLRIVDPFAPANRPLRDRLLPFRGAYSSASTRPRYEHLGCSAGIRAYLDEMAKRSASQACCASA